MGWWDAGKRFLGGLIGGRGQTPNIGQAGGSADPFGGNIFQGQPMGMQGPGYSPPPPVDLGGQDFGFGDEYENPGAGAGYGGINKPDSDPGMTSLDKWTLGLQAAGLGLGALGGWQQGRRQDEIFDLQKDDRQRDIEREERRRKALESGAPSVLASLTKRY